MLRAASALGVVDRFDPHLRYLLDRAKALSIPSRHAPYPETHQYVQRVLRRAGLANSLASAEALYR